MSAGIVIMSGSLSSQFLPNLINSLFSHAICWKTFPASVTAYSDLTSDLYIRSKWVDRLSSSITTERLASCISDPQILKKLISYLKIKKVVSLFNPLIGTLHKPDISLNFGLQNINPSPIKKIINKKVTYSAKKVIHRHKTTSYRITIICVMYASYFCLML